MAEAVVSLVAERLAGLLTEEVTFLQGVHVKFQRLQKELVSIQAFLETVDSIHNPDPGFCIWVADVRDVAYDVDDIIDSYLLQEEAGINNFFKSCARKLTYIFRLHKSGKDLKEIFSKLDEISERRKRYDTTNVHERTISSNTNEMLLRRSYPHQRDNDIIGLEDQKSNLVAELLKVEERLRVVSIYGMGGLGIGKDDVILSILSLSSLELPYHLKPLFLYLGLFPEDSVIRVKKLVRMWMAESLIKEQEGESTEEMGRHYLDELINRCMVQIGRESLVGQRVKTCCLHDKMRDLCSDIGKKKNFFEVISRPNGDSASSSPCSKLGRCTVGPIFAG